MRYFFLPLSRTISVITVPGFRWADCRSQLAYLEDIDLGQAAIPYSMYCYTHHQVTGPPLHMAVGKQSIKKFRKLFFRGSQDINGLDCCGESPLYHAIMQEFEPAVQLLLDKNVNIDLKNNEGNTLLHCCAIKNNKHIAEILINRGCLVNVENNDKNSPLHVAVEYCADVEFLELLISAGADLEHKNKSGQTALFIAARGTKYYDICKCLIDRGADVNVRDNNNQSPVHIAVRHKHLQACELLIAGGAELNQSDDEGNSLLHLAILVNNSSIVKFLLNKGIELESQNLAGETAFLLAMKMYFEYNTDLLTNVALEEMNNDLELDLIIDMLLNRNVNVNVKDTDGNSSLYFALYTVNESLVCKIIHKGADVASTSEDGSTPLHVAALMSVDKPLVELLIEKGADVNAKDRMGLTPLHCVAVTASSSENTECLLLHGAEVNAQDSLERTPLHWAIGNYACDDPLYDWPNYITLFFDQIYVSSPLQSSNVCQVVDKLLEYGANVNMKEEVSETPLLVAVYSMLFGKPPQSLYEQIIIKLIDHGAMLQVRNDVSDSPLAQLVLSDGHIAVKQHIIKMYCAKLIYIDEGENEDFSDMVLQAGTDFRDSCAKEWNEVKAKQIDGHRLCDVFVKNCEPVFVFSETFTQDILSKSLQNSYPLYAELLKKAFKEAQQRLVLLNEAQDSFYILLPPEIIRIILLLLSDFDLKNIIKASKEPSS